MRGPILVSACLLGMPCRYDGKAKAVAGMEDLLKDQVLVAFCPEVAGGLPTPRLKSERLEGRVVNEQGQDVSAAFHRGAQKALECCQALGIKKALLKEGSPSCASERIYDGSFSGHCVPGAGVTTELLRAHDIDVISSDRWQ